MVGNLPHHAQPVPSQGIRDSQGTIRGPQCGQVWPILREAEFPGDRGGILLTLDPNHTPGIAGSKPVDRVFPGRFIEWKLIRLPLKLKLPLREAIGEREQDRMAAPRRNRVGGPVRSDMQQVPLRTVRQADLPLQAVEAMRGPDFRPCQPRGVFKYKGLAGLTARLDGQRTDAVAHGVFPVFPE